MKRVGNRPAQLVRSASRRKKAASRFQFDITVHKVSGIKATGSYYVKWTRGVKVAQTEPQPGTADAAKSGLVFDQKISLMVTLYREEGRKFDPKDSKLSLVFMNGKKSERTVAKLHFDISNFAGVPNASSPKLFKLSEKFSVQTTIDSRFVKSGKGPGSTAASSALSGISARSDDDDDNFGDEFDDLALDDVPEPVVTTTKSKRPLPMGKPPSTPSSPLTDALSSSSVGQTPERKVSASPLKQPAPSTKVSRGLVAGPSSSGSSHSTTSRRERPLPVSSEDVKAFSRVPERERDDRISSLSKENERLSADCSRLKSEHANLENSHKRQVQVLNSKLEQRAREISMAESKRASVSSDLQILTRKHREANDRLTDLTSDIAKLTTERDSLKRDSIKLRESEGAVEKLKREVDRLTVLQASSSGSVEKDEATKLLEKRINELQSEKSRQGDKIRSHEEHAKKIRGTYEELSTMYEKLRKDHTQLQEKLDRVQSEKQSQADEYHQRSLERGVDSNVQLEEARRRVEDVIASKKSLQSDNDRLQSQLEATKEKLEATSRKLEDMHVQNERIYAKMETLKSERDTALRRAFSQGKSNASLQEDMSRSAGRAEESMRATKDKFERDASRMQATISQMESKLVELQEDVEYERTEKQKARDERDQIRVSARSLERRTSLQAKQNDAMTQLRRKLSAHISREQDMESTIARLTEKVSGLESELEKTRLESKTRESCSGNDDGALLEALVNTKLLVAQAESDKLQLQYDFKVYKKEQVLLRDKLAAKASRLEVQLDQTSEALQKFRKRKANGSTTRYNEIGSDVDF